MTAAYPSDKNVFIRDHDASNKMVIDFARNVNDFAVNRYVQIVPTKKIGGLYLEMTIEEAGRILNEDLSDTVWPDGQPAPEGMDGLESFGWKPFTTKRHIFPFAMGDLTVEQATWDIVAQHSNIKCRQAMTARTQKCITALVTEANYASDHVLDVTAISGNSGNWLQSTTSRQDIKRSIETAIEKILDDTLTAIKVEDLQLVINSALAAYLSQTQEIVDYIKGSRDAYAQIRGELPNRNKFYGLPDMLYGVHLEVEATRKVTSRKGATRAVSQILPSATPFLCSRPGELIGVEGAPNFSTCVLFAHEEMTVETKVDADNRRTKGRVVENHTAIVVAPASGVLFTDVV
ncbi:hypothetical protein [Trichococcus shcherbakoviae]|uniref:hypothetical protein n=1 Tax=Trichococcus shcherbakoviae TaxID=2094020 RepID=UPI002AA7BEC0|nr:hypothetical protein [Trichococcus shcherbakoviae]